MEGQKGKWFLIQSQPNPFVSQCRDRRSEKETALAWDVRPVGEGVGMPAAGGHPHLAGWMERATGFLLRTKGLKQEERQLEQESRPLLPGNMRCGVKNQYQRRQK